MENQGQPRTRTFTEELDIAGGQLVDKIRQLIEDGNVRRLRIRTAEGEPFIEIPLTVGVVAGSVLALAMPWLAAIGALAGVAARVKVEVVREVDEAAAPDRPDDERTAL